MAIGFSFPFQVTTGSIGYFQMTEDELEAVENDIKVLLTTNWGERVMHFNFGCNFREFLFEQKVGEELKGRIADRINDQMSKWLPFVIIDQLNILFSDDFGEIPENGIGVAMGFRLTSKPQQPVNRGFIINQNGAVFTTNRLSFISQ